jgi:hypothetical protein
LTTINIPLTGRGGIERDSRQGGVDVPQPYTREEGRRKKEEERRKKEEG